MDPLILLHRCAHATYRWRIPGLPWAFYALNRILFAVVLPPSTRIGRGVKFAYLGLGTVVHGRAVIGEDVTIASNVTIGGRSRHEAVPVIEDDVYIGTGARILGPVTVGRGAVVGANAVVLRDVSPYSVVAGIPATVIRENIVPGTCR